MRIGSWDVQTVLEGNFLLDGGSMFGIVPQALWSRYHKPDHKNRIVMALRALLLVGQDRKILVDCGIGNRFSESQQKIYKHEQAPGGLAGALAKLNIETDQITDVIATHLHFDHVGGMLTKSADGDLLPTFANATVHVQEDCWDWAHTPSVWDAGSFFAGDFDVWDKKLDIRLHGGHSQIAPGVRTRLTCGHTPGQQIVVVGEGRNALVYCADLIPTAAHIRLPYIMAYDHQPLSTLQEKKVLLAQALEENWVLVFEHDPGVTACRLVEKDGRVLPGEQICINSPVV